MPNINFTQFFLIILYIVNLLVFRVSCADCEVCTNNENESDCSSCSNCKFFYVDNTCIACQVTLTSESPYYTKVNEGCITVQKNSISSYKLLYNTKEVVQGNCPSSGDYTKQLGDICYKDVPAYSVGKEGSVNEYECQNSFSITKADFNYYNCYSTSDCSGFKYYTPTNPKECLNSCTGAIKKENNIYRCSEECSTDDSEIEYDETGTGGIIRYCVTTCPSQAKYYYTGSSQSTPIESTNTPTYKCLDKCNEGHFDQNGVCVSSCNDRIILDSEQVTKSCMSNCPKNFPYSYDLTTTNSESETTTIKYCLKSCDDTNKSSLFQTNAIKTYIFEEKDADNNILKSCLATKPTEGDYYKDDISGKWVTDCKLSSSNPFHDENSCKESCTGYSCVTDDTYKCINHIEEDNYYIYEIEGGDNICYAGKCPAYSEKSFFNDDKKCVSCSVGTGFYRAGEKKCYASCQDIDNEKQFYFNDGDNFCFEGICDNNPLYKYHKVDQSSSSEDKIPIACYQSCFNITGIKFEKDYECYENDPGNVEDYYFFQVKEDFKKYTKNAEDCLKSGFPYLKDDNTKECIKECTEYKILPKQNLLGKCCSSLGNCKNETFKYYNDDSKICSDKCEGFIVVDIEGDLITDEQNCLESCPNTYCEDAKNKRCYKECKNYYVEKVGQSDKKIYTDKCDSFYYKESGTVFRCVEVCSKFDGETNKIVYTYYVDGSKECIDTCPKDGTTTNSFSYDTKDTHQPCLSSCKSEEYYYNINENPKICLKECNADDYYESSSSQICVKNCPQGSEYIHPGNICSSSACPASAPFIYKITISVEGENKVYKKCISNCKDTSYPLYKVSFPTGTDKENNECIGIETCEGGYIYNEGCYANCNEGLYIKTESNNKNYCVTKCQKNYFKNSNGIYECIDGCNTQYPYLTSSGECVNECPINENFIGSNNKCLSSCEQDNNKFYELASNNKNYQCIANCYSSPNNKIYMKGTNLCINECSYYLYEKGNDKICYETCISNENASFSTKNTNSEKVCSNACLSDEEKYYYNDKICIDGCSISPNNTINDFDNSCVRSCDLTSEYKFLQRETNNENSALHCKRNCNTSLLTKRFLSSNYICIEKCEIPNNYVVDDISHAKANECLSKCPDDMPYMRKQANGEYFCNNIECGTDEFFYMNTKICMNSCGESLYLYEKDSKKYCVNTCDFLPDEKRYSYETTEGGVTIKKCIPNCVETDSKKYTKLNGMCDIDCDDSEFHVKDEYICMSSCPYGTKNTEDKICEKCEELTTPQYIDENGNCIEDCSNSNYKYHNFEEYQCLSKCDNSKYIEDNICKESCQNKTYMDNKICLEYCPINKRFFVDTDNYKNKTCIYDCPDLYKYYTISGNLFSCTDDCSAYIPNPKMKAQLCLGTGCNETYPFFIKDQEEKKMCHSQCPSSKPYYYVEDTNQNHCYEECPDDTIHLSGDYKCIPYSECRSPYKIKYSIKQCIEQCSKNDLIFEKNNGNTFCLNRCDNITNDMKGRSDLLKLTYDNKCVFDCPSNSKEENDRCICTRLFHYDKSTGYKTCLNADLTLCETVTNYPIIKINQDECTDYCDGILSVSGFECYNNSHKCEKNETLTTLVNGDKKCECINKYYYITENNRNIKKCLGEKDECPLSHQYLIKETKECVNACPETKYNKKYGKTCVSECPSSTEEDNGECKCTGKWYISDNLNVICIKNEDECPSDKEIYVESTKQCVSSCIGTGSEVYYSKTCIGDCEGKDLTTITDSQIDPKMKLISTKYCKCNYLWYYDIDGYEVCKNRDDTITCKDIDGYNFKYVIGLTKQCTNECPEQYPFIFGDECISDCDDNQKKHDELKTCKCRNSWKYNELKQIECLDSCDTNDLQIFSTSQCITGSNCPTESPLFYKKVCYKHDECPEVTEYDKINQKCACKNRWYKDEENLDNCLTENADCPDDYIYIDFETNECKKEKGSLYEVNNTLYHNCPINTTKNDTLKKCTCDPLAGYWYEETKEGKTISVCGLERCEGDYQFNVYLQKQCFRQCDTDLFSYQGICYDKCPNLTEIIPNTNECQLKAVDNEITLNDLEKVMTDNIVDLYKKSETIDIGVSQKIVTKEATVEFYGVNKIKKGHTNQDVKSDLSYIDISECIEKIYKSNNMDEKDNIVILKFDVNRELNNYLITPVEYKFINSRTGKNLDASVCEHNSIRISYPVHNLINRYDKMRAKLRMLEYMKIDLTSNNKDSLREKIDKGKEITAYYPNTDIFDINDKFYSDMCTSVKVNGKDLVIEDRINFFYPKLSLCENNCTYNHTDFINERIYCDCSYKTEFDVKRNYSDSFELNTIGITNNQKSSSNIEVMKCLPNLSNSKSLSKNGGFIYSLIIMILEAILAIVIIFIGINSLSLKLKNKIDKKDDNIEKIEVNVINTNNKKTYEDIKTSERNLDNPPKKKINDFKIEFIPQEYVFLFFSQGEKGIIKKVEKDSVPFKIQYNTRILLEQKKGVNYDNIKPRGPFPIGQNVLVVVDSMDDDINDYIGADDDNEKNKNKNDLIDTSRNRSNNSSRKGSKKIDEKSNNKNDKNSKINMYKKTADQFTISDYDPSDENYSVYDVEEEINEDEDGAAEHHEKGFIETLKKNQRLINRNYEIAMQNKNANFVEILFTEIVDKIYITKILFFTRKFDIFSLQLSVYLLCHLLLLVLNTLFYDINTIKKIWNEENYPGLGYHLGYGFLACLIIWVIYKIFLCLLTNNDKVKDLLKLIHYNNKFNWNKGNEINRKYKNLMWKVKFKFVIYSVIELLLIIFAFLYLTAFGSVYSGTQSNTFKTYGIALIEILIIKIIYGTALAIMRHVSLSKQKKVLYDIVLFMNTYLV